MFFRLLHRSTRARCAGTLTTPRQQEHAPDAPGNTEGMPAAPGSPKKALGRWIALGAVLAVILAAVCIAVFLWNNPATPADTPEPPAPSTEPTDPAPTQPVISMPEPVGDQELVWVSARWSELHGAQPGDVVSIHGGIYTEIPELQYVQVRQVTQDSFELIMSPVQKEAFLRYAGMERKIAVVVCGNPERAKEMLAVQEGVLNPGVRIIMQEKLEAVYGKQAELLYSVQAIPAEAAMPKISWQTEDQLVAYWDDGLKIAGIGTTTITVQCGDETASCEVTVGLPTDGWAQVAHGSRYYYQAGEPVTGWFKLKSDKQEVWYHFDKDGAMSTGWYTENEQRFYLDPKTGIMVTGEITMDGKLYVFDSGNGALISEKEAPAA